MAGAASGVGGLDCVHEWRETAGTPLLKLNEPGVWPFFKLTSLPNFFSGPDADDQRAARTGTYGEEIYTGYARGKTVGYAGYVIGRSRDECLIGKTSLLSAFGPKITDGAVAERRMVISPHPDLVHPDEPDPAMLAHTFKGVVLSGYPQVDDTVPRRITEESALPVGWGLGFTISIRITLGFFYEWNEATDTESNPKWA